MCLNVAKIKEKPMIIKTFVNYCTFHIHHLDQTQWTLNVLIAILSDCLEDDSFYEEAAGILISGD